MQVCRKWHKPRVEICVAEKLEGQSHLSPLIAEEEIQDLICSLLGFGFALVQYIFIIVPTFLPFGIRIYIVHNCISEVCNLLFYFVGKYS